jgi:hypothetical protein
MNQFGSELGSMAGEGLAVTSGRDGTELPIRFITSAWFDGFRTLPLSDFWSVSPAVSELSEVGLTFSLLAFETSAAVDRTSCSLAFAEVMGRRGRDGVSCSIPIETAWTGLVVVAGMTRGGGPPSRGGMGAVMVIGADGIEGVTGGNGSAAGRSTAVAMPTGPDSDQSISVPCIWIELVGRGELEMPVAGLTCEVIMDPEIAESKLWVSIHKLKSLEGNVKVGSNCSWPSTSEVEDRSVSPFRKLLRSSYMSWK